MSGIAELLAFAGVMALGQFSPGPDMLLLTRTALAEGVRAGVLTALGIGTGLAMHGGLAISGTALLFRHGGGWNWALRVLAAGYLGWLAWRLIRATRQAAGPQPSARLGRLGFYLRGLGCNLLNPKVLVFLAAAVAPFLNGIHPSWWPLALWLVIVLQGVFLWGLWAWLLQAAPIRHAYQRAGRLVDLTFAVALLALAGSLLLA